MISNEKLSRVQQYLQVIEVLLGYVDTEGKACKLEVIIFSDKTLRKTFLLLSSYYQKKTLQLINVFEKCIYLEQYAGCILSEGSTNPNAGSKCLQCRFKTLVMRMDAVCVVFKTQFITGKYYTICITFGFIVLL